jgi:hypothetical protein
VEHGTRIIFRDIPGVLRLGEGTPSNRPADRVLVGMAIRVEEGIAARWQRVRRVAWECFLADFGEVTNEDVTTNDRDAAVYRGGTDRPSIGDASCDDKEPA